jgi:hypothetical protein
MQHLSKAIGIVLLTLVCFGMCLLIIPMIGMVIGVMKGLV